MTIELFNMDCMDYLKDCEDNAFDLAIVDPQYGLGMDAKGANGRGSKSPKFKSFKKSQYSGVGWDDKPMPPEYFDELKRVSRHQIIWGANHFIENIKNANSSSWAVWYKKGQCPKSIGADCELAWTSHNTSVKYFRYDWTGFGHINAKEHRIHPTQKPIKLYQWLLENYAEPGQRIIDTHLGSGSSAIAAHYFGVDFVGIELDEDYFNAAKERIERETRQVAMF